MRGVYIPLNRTKISKIAQGQRDGSAKAPQKHGIGRTIFRLDRVYKDYARVYQCTNIFQKCRGMYKWQCAGKRGKTENTQATPLRHLFVPDILLQAFL